MRHGCSIAFLGAGIACAVVADVNSTLYDSKYFWPNLAVWWMPQVFTLCAALFFKPPIALLGGAALALGILPLIVHNWSGFPGGLDGIPAVPPGCLHWHYRRCDKSYHSRTGAAQISRSIRFRRGVGWNRGKYIPSPAYRLSAVHESG